MKLSVYFKIADRNTDFISEFDSWILLLFNSENQLKNFKHSKVRKNEGVQKLNSHQIFFCNCMEHFSYKHGLPTQEG